MCVSVNVLVILASTTGTLLTMSPYHWLNQSVLVAMRFNLGLNYSLGVGLCLAYGLFPSSNCLYLWATDYCSPIICFSD